MKILLLCSFQIPHVPIANFSKNKVHWNNSLAYEMKSNLLFEFNKEIFNLGQQEMLKLHAKKKCSIVSSSP
jgi:hypothetical protein